MGTEIRLLVLLSRLKVSAEIKESNYSVKSKN